MMFHSTSKPSYNNGDELIGKLNNFVSENLRLENVFSETNFTTFL